VASLATASLSAQERGVLERLVPLLEVEFGAHLRGVWLYGSRARGEPPHPESDVDLIVVATRGHLDDDLRVTHAVFEAADVEGANPAGFSVHLYDPDYIRRRREIRSFFMQEVDRDKIVLFGEP
jgi:predicted nucleotidyltransferase